MKGRQEKPNKQKYLISIVFIILIILVILLIVSTRKNKQYGILGILPELTNSVTDSASKMTDEEKEEDEGYIVEKSPLIGLSATEVYLKMKEEESQVKNSSDYLNMVNTYYSKVYRDEIWHEYINTKQEERIKLIQKKLAATPRRDQIVELKQVEGLESQNVLLIAVTTDNQKTWVELIFDNDAQAWLIDYEE